MSTLLVNEPPLVVLPSLAKLVGINQAIVLQQVQYWASKEKNVRDGHRWVYNTYEAWLAQFPWMSMSTLKRSIRDLEERGYLISETPKGTDRTKWYRIDYAKLDADGVKVTQCNEPSGQNEPTNGSDCTAPSGQNDPMYKGSTESTPETTPEKHIRTRLNENAPITASMLQHAQDKGILPADIAAQYELFRNHHAAKGSLMVSWDAAWRTWVANAIKWEQVTPQQAKPSGPLTQAELAQRDYSDWYPYTYSLTEWRERRANGTLSEKGLLR